MEYYQRKGHYRKRKDGTRIYIKPMRVRNTRRRTTSLTKKNYPRYIRSAFIRSQKKMFGKDYWKTSLGRYGYKQIATKNARQRHLALANAIRKLGYSTVCDRMKKMVGMNKKKIKRKSVVSKKSVEMIEKDYEWMRNLKL